VEQKGAVRRIHVWHDHAGRIVAWGHVPTSLPIALQATPLAGPNQYVVQVEAPEDALPTLHETHYVEPNSRMLARREKG
jgi:hypothetical protein